MFTQCTELRQVRIQKEDFARLDADTILAHVASSESVRRRRLEFLQLAGWPPLAILAAPKLVCDTRAQQPSTRSSPPMEYSCTNTDADHERTCAYAQERLRMSLVAIRMCTKSDGDRGSDPRYASARVVAAAGGSSSYVGRHDARELKSEASKATCAFAWIFSERPPPPPWSSWVFDPKIDCRLDRNCTVLLLPHWVASAASAAATSSSSSSSPSSSSLSPPRPPRPTASDSDLHVHIDSSAALAANSYRVAVSIDSSNERQLALSHLLASGCMVALGALCQPEEEAPRRMPPDCRLYGNVNARTAPLAAAAAAAAVKSSSVRCYCAAHPRVWERAAGAAHVVANVIGGGGRTGAGDDWRHHLVSSALSDGAPDDAWRMCANNILQGTRSLDDVVEEG